MTTLASLLVCSLLSVPASPATRPVDAPPLPSPASLKDDAALAVQRVEAADAVAILRDGGGVRLQLAGVNVSALDAAAQDAAIAFLSRLLADERVWMVPALSSSGPSGKWYLYRWPDRLLVNLELVRQGYADALEEPGMNALTRRAFVHWRDQARRGHKGIWGVSPASPTARASTAAPAAARQPPSSRPADPPAFLPPDTETVHPPVAVQPASTTPERRVLSSVTTVYVSSTGTKYHRANCRSLRKTGTPMPLDEARKRYEPCKQCKPPQ